MKQNCSALFPLKIFHTLLAAYLDKLVDELAKGKKLEKVLRK